jgi:hypothetical protein
MRRSRCIASDPRDSELGRPRTARGRALPWLLALIAIAAAAWWYLAPQTLPEFLRRPLPASPRANPPLYKWRDAQGVWHVTDTPPADRPYETVRYNPDVNVVPSVVPPSAPKPR